MCFDHWEWQVAHDDSVMPALWLGVAGGKPWQLPHDAPPCCVHTGRAEP